MDPSDTQFVLYIFDEYLAITLKDHNQCLVLGRELNDGMFYIGIELKDDIPFRNARHVPMYAIFGIFWLLNGRIIWSFMYFYGVDTQTYNYTDI